MVVSARTDRFNTRQRTLERQGPQSCPGRGKEKNSASNRKIIRYTTPQPVIRDENGTRLLYNGKRKGQHRTGHEGPEGE